MLAAELAAIIIAVPRHRGCTRHAAVTEISGADVKNHPTVALFIEVCDQPVCRSKGAH